MLITVHVTPNAKEASVVRVGEASFEARVDERAEQGRANKRLVALISEHLGVPKSSVSIVRGARSRDKVLEVAAVVRSTRAPVRAPEGPRRPSEPAGRPR